MPLVIVSPAHAGDFFFRKTQLVEDKKSINNFLNMAKINYYLTIIEKLAKYIYIYHMQAHQAFYLSKHQGRDINLLKTNIIFSLQL